MYLSKVVRLLGELAEVGLAIRAVVLGVGAVAHTEGDEAASQGASVVGEGGCCQW